MSALNLSRKLDRVFDGRPEMAMYGAVEQHPYSFQDDVLIPVESVEDPIVASYMDGIPVL